MLDWLYRAIAEAIVGIHGALAPIPGFGRNSGLTWGLSIVLLVVAMRLLLFPLFAKSFRSQRRMMELQPKLAALKAKHGHDRQKMAEEQMKLFKEHNVNPFGSCLPLLIQAPIFFSLFVVLRDFKPNGDGTFSAEHGISAELVESAAKAKIFGAPLASSFTSGADLLERLDASVGTARLVAAVLIVAMTAAQFLASRQMFTRSAARMPDNPQLQQQKIIMYALPLVFGVSAFFFHFPVGVLLYWLTTNLWSLGQQQIMIKHMVPIDAAPAARPAKAAAPSVDTASSGADVARTAPTRRQQPARRNRKSRKGGRR